MERCRTKTLRLEYLIRTYRHVDLDECLPVLKLEIIMIEQFCYTID